MTSQELKINELAEKFYNAMRGFIVIEESGLPKYIEFLTEEKIDIILLSGLLSSLQSLAEVISDEKIRSIETSNSKFIFEVRSGYFYVIWIEKTIQDLDLYDPIIMKIISRFEGASNADIDQALLISNLTETPEYEKIGERISRFRSSDTRYSDSYKKLLSEKIKDTNAEKVSEELAGLEGIIVINNGTVEYSEFSSGKPLFDIEALTNFFVGLKNSIGNLDPGVLEEITTQNYRFIIEDKLGYFYVFKVIKGLANESNLEQIIQRIMSRYEGLRRKNNTNMSLLKDLEIIPEHELLGQLSLEIREMQEDEKNKEAILERQASKVSFGDDEFKWMKENEQMNAFMDIYKEAFMVGIICPLNRFFVMRKTFNVNDWMQAAKNMDLEKLLELTKVKDINQLTNLAFNERDFLLVRLTNNSILFTIVDYSSPTIERYVLRLAKIILKISKNIM